MDPDEKEIVGDGLKDLIGNEEEKERRREEEKSKQITISRTAIVSETNDSEEVEFFLHDQHDRVPLVVENLENANLDESLETEEDNEFFAVTFPVAELAKLDELVSNTRWVVPVLPGGQLEILLDAAINLCKRGLDEKSEPCQRFFREGLTISFTKILTDDAVTSWKPEIQKCILKNSERLIDLVITKMSQDWFPLLEILGILFNPSNKFNTFNSCRSPESYPIDQPIPDDELFARCPEARIIKGWLVDLINHFGSQNGFQLVLDRFQSETPLSVALIYALLKPFGNCIELLTKHTVKKFFAPILKTVPQILENLSDEELKKETAKSDLISLIIKCLKVLQGKITDSEDQSEMRNLELFRLRMILRMLQVSSFNGKMNALNEINQVIQNVMSYYPHAHHHHRGDEMEYLTSKRIAEWLSENQVLQIVLRDSLHQPQYVEKMEKILRFIIKERSLTLKDLDDIWAAQVGKHDAIVKNVHDLLAKLAWDFSPDQLDHLFECFQDSWTTANKRQREKLLELIRRLAEDDKDGVMAFKVLTLFWNLAQSTEVPTEIMDQALAAHVKVLDYSCSQMRDNQKHQWLNKSMDQLMADDVTWVIPAMKHMREIFSLYPEATSNHKNPTAVFRKDVILKLQTDRLLIVQVCKSLSSYMEKVRAYTKEKGFDVYNVKLDGRYSHFDQIKERLHFLRFILKDGNLYLCEQQANLIWQCLAESPAFPSDREMCFEWFSKLMGDDPDLDPKFTQPFFEKKILTFDPTVLTELGMDCFERFFKAVNIANKNLIMKREDCLMDNIDLTGGDYIWRVILYGNEDISLRAIQFLRAISTALGPKLIPNQTIVHEDSLSSCIDRLKASHDTILGLEKDKDSTNIVRQEVTKLCRVLRFFHEYIVECDSNYGEERAFIPLFRASRGKNLSIYVRIPSQIARGFEDVDISSHYNETPAGLRRQIIRQLKEFTQSSSYKFDFFYNGEVIDLSGDHRTIQQFGIRDKMVITAKFTQNNVTNSPDSSEESSGGSPNHFQIGTDGPNIEAEESLPSVMLSKDSERMAFLCKLCGLGSSVGEEKLREAARQLLSVLPICRHTEISLKNAFLKQTDKKPYNLLFNTDPSTVLYRLEVLYALLFPSSTYDTTENMELLRMFFVSGGASAVVEMLTKNNFMPLADVATKRSAYYIVLKLTKAVLTITLHLLVRYERDMNPVGDNFKILAEALSSVPSPNSEVNLRKVAERLSLLLLNQLRENTGEYMEGLKLLLKSAREGNLPDIETIRLGIKLAGHTASGSLAHIANEQHQMNREPTEEDGNVCEEALEVLTLSFVLNPSALDLLIQESSFKNFVRAVLFHTPARNIRYMANEQFYVIATRCGNHNVLIFFIMLLFDIVQNSIQEYKHHSRDVFYLLCNLLRHSHSCVPLPKHEKLLEIQINWLRKTKDLIKMTGEGSVSEDLLDGNISIARELCNFLTPEKKYQLGCDPAGGNSLIKEILEEFVFPWSKAHSALKMTGELNAETPVQICAFPNSQNSILELVVSLCMGSYPNLKLTVEILTKIFSYTNDGDGLNDWEYIPPVGSRPMGGFVGLKNAGATCYMNSVIQQLFMVEAIKRGVLIVSTLDSEYVDEGVDEGSSDSSTTLSGSNTSSETVLEGSDDRKNYNICILKQVQAIFGHLALSKLQYYVPNGLWKHFRLQGEPVNLREQQDAVEFFMSLIESVDDGLKALGEDQIMAKNLGGLFSDQKICKECPHRYSKEEPFSVISVDIRNHSNLLDSLEQYVKGELLEGADAYHCERCNKKVVTVKRLCVKKLPPVLAIQLKRFEYDYERVCPIKFNDYFEFPRELDMEPYTVTGLAKIEGEMIDSDDGVLLGQNMSSLYRLTGIVVHSGQASGGHYYSYISFKCPNGVWRWYKFDDGEVSECRMEDDEELKNQCFGGDYSGEVFDHMMKRMSFRRQKRWWNAYILFYTQTDVIDSNMANLSNKVFSLSLYEKRPKIPPMIEKSVLKHNIEFMHIRSHFSPEYFTFVRRLVGANAICFSTEYMNDEADQLALLSIKLATQFLFSIGFRTKKTLRGMANDWYEVILPYLKNSKNVRFWFATNALFRDHGRIAEYLLECPNSEVRSTFAKMLVFLAHYSKDDGIYIPSIPMATLTRSSEKNAHLWEYILESVLNLLRRDVSEYGRHLVQYFGFFVSYANIGEEEKRQLIKLDVPGTFMLVALDEGPAPPIKYQCADLTKLYQVVSILVRSCDVSHKCESNILDERLTSNPFLESSLLNGPLMVLPASVSELLYGRGGSCSQYIKKIISDNYASEDTIQLIQFLCWENHGFSQIIISEILGHVGFSYTPELKSYLEMLMHTIRINDSFQLERITYALRGLPEDKDGLLDIIHRNKQSHPKRAYLFIKYVTNIMEPNGMVFKVLTKSLDLVKKWNSAVEWLQHELGRRMVAGGSSYGYSATGWSPPSNETANGSFFLERSLSAKATLDKALEFRVDPEQLLHQYENEEDQVSSEGEEDEKGKDLRMDACYELLKIKIQESRDNNRSNKIPHHESWQNLKTDSVGLLVDQLKEPENENVEVKKEVLPEDLPVGPLVGSDSEATSHLSFEQSPRWRFKITHKASAQVPTDTETITPRMESEELELIVGTADPTEPETITGLHLSSVETKSKKVTLSESPHPS